MIALNRDPSTTLGTKKLILKYWGSRHTAGLFLQQNIIRPEQCRRALNFGKNKNPAPWLTWEVSKMSNLIFYPLLNQELLPMVVLNQEQKLAKSHLEASSRLPRHFRQIQSDKQFRLSQVQRLASLDNQTISSTANGQIARPAGAGRPFFYRCGYQRIGLPPVSCFPPNDR